MIRLFSRVTSTILLVALLLSSPAAGQDAAIAMPSALSGPLSGDDPLLAEHLDLMQEHMREVIARVLPAVVAIQTGSAGGSGVIVSEDGLVLTAGHVVESRDAPVTILLPDGTRLAGRALGANRNFDTGMMRITDPGPWPYVDLGDSSLLREGQWCLAIGQPLGFDVRRRPPVRLGRVVRLDPHVVQTDCTIVSGDSGGPLFDMLGRVIGIHSRIGTSLVDNVHVPIGDFRSDWDHLLKGEIWGNLGRSAGDPDAPYLGANPGRGEGAVIGRVTPNGPADRAGLIAGDRIATFGAVPIRRFEDVAIELSRRLPGDSVPVEFWRAGLIDEVELIVGRRGEASLPAERRPSLDSLTRGPEMRELLTRVAAWTTHEAVAEVARVGFREALCLATVVSYDGLLVTKASEVSGVEPLEVRLADGRVEPASVVEVSSPHDLALLRVSRDDLAPVRFAAVPPAGSFAISPGFGDELARSGIVSAPPRHYGRSRAYLGITIGSSEGGVMVNSVEESGAAQVAGMTAGDVIVEVDGTVVDSSAALLDVLGKLSPGDTVVVIVRRDAGEVELAVELGERPEEESGRRQERLMGELSRRRSDFPDVVQHDVVISPDRCGGPVVGLDGVAFGVNIARSSRVESYAVPGTAVMALVAEYRRDHLDERVSDVERRRADAEARRAATLARLDIESTIVGLLSELEDAVRTGDDERAALIARVLAETRRKLATLDSIP